MDIMLNHGDIRNDIFGDILLANDDTDIIQSAVCNIMTAYGENPFHENIGNKVLNNRNKLSESNLISIQDLCRQAIMNDSRVAAVQEVTATRNYDMVGGCDITFELKTRDNKVLGSRITMSVLE